MIVSTSFPQNHLCCVLSGWCHWCKKKKLLSRGVDMSVSLWHNCTLRRIFSQWSVGFLVFHVLVWFWCWCGVLGITDVCLNIFTHIFLHQLNSLTLSPIKFLAPYSSLILDLCRSCILLPCSLTTTNVHCIHFTNKDNLPALNPTLHHDGVTQCVFSSEMLCLLS